MLKKLFSILLSVMLIVNACAVTGVFAAANESQTPTNLIGGGDFEGTISDYWIASTVTADTSNPHGGTQAAKSTGRTSATILKKNGVTFKVDRTYDCEVWIKGAESTNTFNANIGSETVRTDTDNDGWTLLFEAKSPEGVDTWTRLNGTIKMLADSANPTNTENSYVIEFKEYGESYTNPVYIDDFSIVPKYYVNSISITGDDTVSFPGATYTAQVLNQTGNTDEVPQNVTWSITSAPNGVSIVEDTGELIIENSNTEGTVVIKATAEEYGCIAFNEKTVTLEKAELPPKSEAERKELVEEKLTSSVILDTNTSLNAVTSDLKLTQSTGYDDIKWYSDKPDVVNPDTGAVTRTAYDELVQLIAEYTIEEITYTETVDLCVLAADGTENPKVAGNNIFPEGDFARGNTNIVPGWYEVDETVKINGSNTLKSIDQNKDKGTPLYLGWYNPKNKITIEKGVAYRYTGWIKFDEQISTTHQVYLQVDGTNVLVNGGNKANIGVNDTNWHRMDGVYTLAGGMGETAEITLKIITPNSVPWRVAGLTISPITDTTPARIYEDNGMKLLSNSELTGAMAINKLLRPTTADGADVTMLAASYDADKQLLDCSLISDTLTTDTAKNLCTKLSAKADTKYVKVFLWNKTSVMNPLRALETFEVPTVE